MYKQGLIVGFMGALYGPDCTVFIDMLWFCVCRIIVTLDIGTLEKCHYRLPSGIIEYMRSLSSLFRRKLVVCADLRFMCE